MRGPSTAAGGIKGMLGWDEEWDNTQGGVSGAPTQNVDAAGLTEFDKGARNVPTSVKVELRSSYPLEVYTVSVRFSARMEGLRWLMYRYWLTSAITGTTLFWSVEMSVLLFTWAIFTLLFSKSDPHPGHKQIKQESGTTTPKREDTEPSTPFSETSRTFPSLSSHQQLQYQAPAVPKSERDSPVLEDIPTREEAEADDEDDDFVLEEPLPRTGEKDGEGFESTQEWEEEWR
ncbi:hypothetical protein SNOG_08097 [Parastagonospora nodorum SN15]|uniref:Seipin n=1 Tax=Phaeosphaeria nodorum (strain SN15 / ATCC MYA-4574 / FGSC 10173) TaxID=321614 RepID=Q0UJG7_PHANO|nr:hypothetical protein SNOG_08097 [Parastagonospora nodorum SN15]EAT84373.2 hypothetical protein SNOG_08097 [Parastagonospora nodorum SN15]